MNIEEAKKAVERVLNDRSGFDLSGLDAPTRNDMLAAIVRAVRMPEPAKPQHDPGAHTYMREAIQLLMHLSSERDRQTGTTDHGKYDEMTIVIGNARDAYEWLWPKLWREVDVPYAPVSFTVRTQ